MQPDNEKVSFWPTQASTLADDVDIFYAAMIGISVLATVLIVAVLIYFCVRYRRRDGDYRPPHVETSKALEVVWTVIPLILCVGMFVWGAQLFFKQTYIPDNAMPIDVTGKQWMFKFQHPNGRREINALHVPKDVPIKLTMATEDVIHDLFIPDFRIKHDLVPGRYTMTWFEATKTGTYHLFCNQYCGTQHSSMIGSVIVMEPVDYQNWLSGYTGETPLQAGEKLFAKNACITCHAQGGSGARGPSLANLLGAKVQLNDGTVVTADREYIRESILKPQEKIVAGFTPIMPSFQGILSEEQIGNLITYIESLSNQNAAVGASQAAAGAPSVDGHGSAAGQTGVMAAPDSTATTTDPLKSASPGAAHPGPQATSPTGEKLPDADVATRGPQSGPAPAAAPQAATPAPAPETTPAPASETSPAPPPPPAPAPSPTPASTPAPTPDTTPAPAPSPSPAPPTASNPAPAATPTAEPASTTSSSTTPQEAQ